MRGPALSSPKASELAGSDCAAGDRSRPHRLPTLSVTESRTPAIRRALVSLSSGNTPRLLEFVALCRRSHRSCRDLRAPGLPTKAADALPWMESLELTESASPQVRSLGTLVVHRLIRPILPRRPGLTDSQAW